MKCLNKLCAVMMIFFVVFGFSGCDDTQTLEIGYSDGSTYRAAARVAEMSFLCVATGRETLVNGDGEITVDVKIGIEELFKDIYNEGLKSTLYVRLRHSVNGSATVKTVENVLMNESIFVDYYSYVGQIYAEDLEYSVSIPLKKEIFPALYRSGDVNITDSVCIDVVFEAEGYYREVATMKLGYDRFDGRRVLTLPSGIKAAE